MQPKQSNSNFWGTGTELAKVRSAKDAKEFDKFFKDVGKKLFADRFDYSSFTFRGLLIPTTIKDKKSGEEIVITPLEHLMRTTEDIEMQDTMARTAINAVNDELQALIKDFKQLQKNVDKLLKDKDQQKGVADGNNIRPNK